MAISVFDLFKIGIGSSRWYAVRPVRAVAQLSAELAGQQLLSRMRRLQGLLYGSVSSTSIGYANANAMLMGKWPDQVDRQQIGLPIERLKTISGLLLGQPKQAVKVYERGPGNSRGLAGDSLGGLAVSAVEC